MTRSHTDEYLEHPFNNCGVAPFEFVGFAERLYYPCKYLDGSPNTSVPPMAGGTCAHCGTGIRNAYIIRDANGKEFDVGCDCLTKVNLPPKVMSAAKAEKRKQDRIKRHAREQAKIAELQPQYDAVKDKLKEFPHPNSYYAGLGRTLFDYYEYALGGSGNSGTIRNMKAAIAKAKGE